jgi:hypothetical protein
VGRPTSSACVIRERQLQADVLELMHAWEPEQFAPFFDVALEAIPRSYGANEREACSLRTGVIASRHEERC